MPLDRSQNRKSALGAILIISIVVIAAVVFFLGDIVRLTQRSIKVIALVPDAAELDTGTPVWIAGREVGSIKEIHFRGVQTDSSERLALVLQIPREYADQIRLDARVRVTSAMMIGKPVIEIYPGSAAFPAIRDHDTLRVRPKGTLEGVMDRAMALTADFERLIVDTRSFQQSARRGSVRLNELQNNLTAVTTSFRTFTTSLQQSPLSDPRLRTLLGDISRHNREIREQLGRAQERARQSRTEMQPALHQLMARSDTISRVLAELRMHVTENGGGLLVRAQKDSAIVKALHEAQVQLDSLMAETKRNPLRYWF